MSITQAAVDQYKRAYERFHGEPPRLISARNGWINFAHLYGSNRPTEILEMAERLDRRRRENDSLTTNVLSDGRVVHSIPNKMEWPDLIQKKRAEERFHENNPTWKENIIRELSRKRNIIEEIENRGNNVWDVRDELKKSVRKQIDDQAEAILNDEEPLHTPVLGWRKSIKKNLIVAFFNRLFEDCGNSGFNMDTVMNEYAFSGEWILDDNEADCSECEYRQEHDYMVDKIENFQSRIRHMTAKNELKDKELSLLKTELKMLHAKFDELKKNAVIFSMDFDDRQETKRKRNDDHDDIPF